MLEVGAVLALSWSRDSASQVALCALPLYGRGLPGWIAFWLGTDQGTVGMCMQDEKKICISCGGVHILRDTQGSAYCRGGESLSRRGSSIFGASGREGNSPHDGARYQSFCTMCGMVYLLAPMDFTRPIGMALLWLPGVDRVSG